MKYTTNPISEIESEKQTRFAFQYAQDCATALVNFGLMTPMEHKKFIKKVENWLKKYGMNPKTTHT